MSERTETPRHRRHGTSENWPRLSPFRTGMRGKCPRCGEGRLFSGFLSLAPSCEVCGLEYAFADPADGPAFFSMMFFCLPPAFVAVWLQVQFDASYLVNAAITIPLIVLCCVLPLRPLKGWLVASQFYYKAEEGKRITLPRIE